MKDTNFSSNKNISKILACSEVLVTGAAGYLASHCVKELLEHGYSVRGTVRSVKNTARYEHLQKLPHATTNLEFIEADLEDAETWPKAVSGCAYVLHVASPIPIVAEENIIGTAINGTLNVLKACAKEPSVKKVVLTSSLLTVFSGHTNIDHKTYVFTEKDWANIENGSLNKAHYIKSKTLAEQAAWKFMKDLSRNDHHFRFTVCVPGLIMGPGLSQDEGRSATMIKKLMNNDPPAVPHVKLPLVDVRDVAKAHVRAMENEKTDEQRIFLCAETIWFKDIAQILKKEFGHQGYSLPSLTLPNPVVCFASIFSDEIKPFVSSLGKDLHIDSSKAKQEIDIDFIKPENTLVDMAYKMIENGLIPKKAGYTGPKN